MLNYFKSKLPPQVSSAFSKATPTPAPAPILKKEKPNYSILGLTDTQKAKIDKNINDIRQSIKYVTIPKLKDLLQYDLLTIDEKNNEEFILFARSTSASLKESEESLRYLKNLTNEVLAIEQEAKNAFRGRLRGNTRVNKPTNTVSRKNRKTRRR
jgi:hypothetical protein